MLDRQAKSKDELKIEVKELKYGQWMLCIHGDSARREDIIKAMPESVDMKGYIIEHYCYGTFGDNLLVSEVCVNHEKQLATRADLEFLLKVLTEKKLFKDKDVKGFKKLSEKNLFTPANKPDESKADLIKKLNITISEEGICIDGDRNRKGAIAKAILNEMPESMEIDGQKIQHYCFNNMGDNLWVTDVLSKNEKRSATLAELEFLLKFLLEKKLINSAEIADTRKESSPKP